MGMYRYRTSEDGRTSGRARKSVNLARVRGSGRSEKVGRPVVPGALDVRERPVVRWVGVNARCEFRDMILGGIWGFWVKIEEVTWIKDGETWGDDRST